MAQPDPDPLRRYLAVQRDWDRRLIKLLQGAAQDVERSLDRLANRTGRGALMRTLQLRLAQQAINRAMAAAWRRLGDEIAAGRIASAAEAIEVDRELSELLARGSLSPVQAEGLTSALRASAANAIELVRVREEISRIELSARVYRNTQLAQGKVDRLVNSALARGLSARELAGEVLPFIRPDVRGGMSYAAMRLGRTELNNAFHAQSILNNQELPWVSAMRWNLSGSHPRPDVCDALARTVASRGLDAGVYPKMQVPSKPHPQCFPGDTIVSANQIGAASKRWYSGDLIQVFTEASDRPQFSGTPNHPTLTTRGWVPLGEVREGDYVVYHIPSDRVMPAVMPHEENVKARIEDVFCSLEESFPMSSASMPSSAEQFHGDGSVGDVDVVRTDSLLQGAPFEIAVHPSLDIGYTYLAELPSNGSGDSLIKTLRNAPDRSVRCLGALLSDILWHDVSRFLSGPEAGTISPYRAAYRADPYLSYGGHLLESLAGEVELRKVFVASRIRYDGHVYNLQTDSGWYTANGFIVHNCLCYITPVTDSKEDFVRSYRSGQYDAWLAQQGVQAA